VRKLSILWWKESEIFWVVDGMWDILVCGRNVCILWQSEIFEAVGGKYVFCGVRKVRCFGMCEESGIFWCV